MNGSLRGLAAVVCHATVDPARSVCRALGDGEPFELALAWPRRRGSKLLSALVAYCQEAAKSDRDRDRPTK